MCDSNSSVDNRQFNLIGIEPAISFKMTLQVTRIDDWVGWVKLIKNQLSLASYGLIKRKKSPEGGFYIVVAQIEIN